MSLLFSSRLNLNRLNLNADERFGDPLRFNFVSMQAGEFGELFGWSLTVTVTIFIQKIFPEFSSVVTEHQLLGPDTADLTIN